MQYLRRSFIAYPIFGICLSAFLGTWFASSFESLRPSMRLFILCAPAAFAIDAFARMFYYFGIPGGYVRVLRRGVYACSCFLLFAGLFWLRVPEKPIENFAPAAISAKCQVMQVSRSERTAYGVARVIESDVSELSGSYIWFTVARPKRGSHPDVPLFSRSDTILLKGILRPVRIRPPAAWGYVKDAHSEASFNNYLLSRFIYFKLFANSYNASVLSRAPESAGSKISAFISGKLSDAVFSGGDFSVSNNVLKAMILGDKSQLRAEDKQIFKEVGAMHVFAVSGLHVGIAALAAYFFCSLISVPFKLRPFVALPLLFLYVWACGFPPSAVRAFIMVVSFWIALVFSRGSNSMNALMVSALAAIIVDPKVIFTAGFQLSYAVTATLLLFSISAATQMAAAFSAMAPRSGLWRTCLRVFEFVAGGFLIALGGGCVAAPISAYWFGAFSISGIFVSPFLVGLATCAVFLAAASIILPFGLGAPFACLATFATYLMLEISAITAKFMPWLVDVRLDSPILCIFFVVCALVLFLITGQCRWHLRAGAAAGFFTLTMFSLWIFQ